MCACTLCTSALDTDAGALPTLSANPPDCCLQDQFTTFLTDGHSSFLMMRLVRPLRLPLYCPYPPADVHGHISCGLLHASTSPSALLHVPVSLLHVPVSSLHAPVSLLHVPVLDC